MSTRSIGPHPGRVCQPSSTRVEPVGPLDRRGLALTERQRICASKIAAKPAGSLKSCLSGTTAGLQRPPSSSSGTYSTTLGGAMSGPKAPPSEERMMSQTTRVDESAGPRPSQDVTPATKLRPLSRFSRRMASMATHHSTRGPLQPNDQVLTPSGHDIPSAVRSPANRRTHDLSVRLQKAPGARRLMKRTRVSRLLTSSVLGAALLLASASSAEADIVTGYGSTYTNFTCDTYFKQIRWSGWLTAAPGQYTFHRYYVRPANGAGFWTNYSYRYANSWGAVLPGGTVSTLPLATTNYTIYAQYGWWTGSAWVIRGEWTPSYGQQLYRGGVAVGQTTSWYCTA